jgi:hypothetical protein
MTPMRDLHAHLLRNIPAITQALPIPDRAPFHDLLGEYQIAGPEERLEFADRFEPYFYFAQMHAGPQRTDKAVP